MPDLTIQGSAQSALHEQAAAMTRGSFGSDVFVRAVVEISNFCREDCSYCGMRRSNKVLNRYRAQVDQLAESIVHHRPQSVTDINIQAGEDPVAAREVALPLIKILKERTRRGVSLCLGTLSAELYLELQAAGASLYIMKFECADPAHYRELRAPGTLSERIAHIRLLSETGWMVSSGFIAGLPGQTPEKLQENLELAESLPLQGCSVSPFIPGELTPLSNSTPANIDWTLNCMAALRLRQAGWVIPAVSALNLADASGYRRGLRAGANLVTINITPEPLRQDYVIYKRDRFIMSEAHVLGAIEEEGLSPSKQGLADFYRNKRSPSFSPAPTTAT